MRSLSIFLFLFFFTTSAMAQKDQLEKVWYNQEKSSRIMIYKGTDNKYYGKIVWLKIPNNDNGTPRTDKNNPENSKRQIALQGLVILKGFVRQKNSDTYEDGTIYDPNNGKSYCGKITFKGQELDLRGFLCSFSILGRTSTWTLAE